MQNSTIVIIASVCLFLDLMIPTVLITLFPGATIRLLEAFRFYGKGKLQSANRDCVDGKGIYVNRRCYVSVKNGEEKLENGRVFGYMLLIFIPDVIFLGIAAYFLLNQFYSL